MTVTTFDKLLAIIGAGLWVTLILAVVVVLVAIHRNRGTAATHIEAYQLGWTEGTVDALNTHGPKADPGNLDTGAARLLWLTDIEQSEPNPYAGDG